MKMMVSTANVTSHIFVREILQEQEPLVNYQSRTSLDCGIVKCVAISIGTSPMTGHFYRYMLVMTKTNTSIIHI